MKLHNKATLKQPRQNARRRIERRAEALQLRGTIHVVLNVVLPRPHDFHRRTDPLRQLHGFDYEVLVRAPAKAAAEEGDVRLDLVERKFGEL